MAASKRMYRSDDVVVAGVCSGIADGLDLDHAAVRILFCLLFVATFGLISLVYAWLWLVLPRQVSYAPETLSCEAYSASGASCPIASRVASGEGGEDESGKDDGIGGWTRACLWIALAFFSIAASCAIAAFVPSIVWWRFLPLAVCLAGAALMLTPAHATSRMRRFSLGLLVLFLGISLLSVSVGVVLPENAVLAAIKLWPGTFVVVGMVIIGMATHEDLFILGAAAVAAVLLVCSMLGYAQPDSFEIISQRMQAAESAATGSAGIAWF